MNTCPLCRFLLLFLSGIATVAAGELPVGFFGHQGGYGGGTAGGAAGGEGRAGLFRQRQSAESDAEKAAAQAACQQAVPPIQRGPGSNGRYNMQVTTLPNPAWPGGMPVSIFMPAGFTGRAPVVFFSHAWGSDKWQAYQSFLEHIVSLGMIVVYPPYKATGASADDRYSMLWGGFQSAVSKFRDRMDLDRVAFVGHSFGGGATPMMAYKGLVENGWGKEGALLFVMAPWYSYEITRQQLNAFPSNVHLLVQLYDADDTNDHRMGIDIYRSLKLAGGNRRVMMVKSGQQGICSFKAIHGTPFQKQNSDSIKQRILFRPFDELAEFCFHGDREGRSLTNAEQGLSDFPRIEVTSDPHPDKPEQSYKFPWRGHNNPRAGDEPEWD